MIVTVVVPTLNPDADRFRRTLAGLSAQGFAREAWELVVVDNCSSPPVRTEDLASLAGLSVRLELESQPGLTNARRRGLASARGEHIVLVDDDNVLAPDYLERVVGLFQKNPRLGILGGKCLPEFESQPMPWVREFDDLIACRDLGPEPLVSTGLRRADSAINHYPAFAPVGAGMAIRRDAARAWLDTPRDSSLTDRRGGELTSAGDNDIVFSVMKSGWEAGYFPELSLTHLIPASRTTRDYLARLNRGIAKSWIRVLRKHDACPWPPIAAWTVPLRKAKAWFACRAWSGPAAHVRWQGACGHFEGLAPATRS